MAGDCPWALTAFPANKGTKSTYHCQGGHGKFLWAVLQVQALFLQIRCFFFLHFETRTPKAEAFTDKMGDKKYKVPLVEDTKVRVLYETEAFGPVDKADYPPTGTNSIYSAILSRNEAVKDAKRLKTFLELRDKYVTKKVVFEDPLFPADDSSLFYSHKPSMKIEWKRPSVSASL